MSSGIDRILQNRPLMNLVNGFVAVMVTRASLPEAMQRWAPDQWEELSTSRQGRLHFARSRWDIRAELEESGEGPEFERALREASSNAPPITVIELLDCALEHLVISRVQHEEEHGHVVDWQDEDDSVLMAQEASAGDRFRLGLARKMHFRGFEDDAVEVGSVPDHLELTTPLHWKIADDLGLVLFAEPRAHLTQSRQKAALLGVEGVCSPGARAMLLTDAAPLFRMLLPELLKQPPKSSEAHVVLQEFDIVKDVYYASHPRKKRYERSLQNAAVLMIEAEKQSRIPVGLALFVAAMEALISGGLKDGISEAVARRVAVMFAPAVGERSEVKKVVKRLYGARSDVLHGTSLKVAQQSRDQARALSLATLRGVVRWLQRQVDSPGDLGDELDRHLENGTPHPLAADWSPLISPTALVEVSSDE